MNSNASSGGSATVVSYFVMERSSGSQLVGEEDSCPLPPFLVHFATLGMIAFTVLTSISYIIKTFVVISLMVAQICLNLIQLRRSFNWYDVRMYGRELNVGHDVALSLVLLTAAVVLFWINRQVNIQFQHPLMHCRFSLFTSTLLLPPSFSPPDARETTGEKMGRRGAANAGIKSSAGSLRSFFRSFFDPVSVRSEEEGRRRRRRKERV